MIQFEPDPAELGEVSPGEDSENVHIRAVEADIRRLSVEPLTTEQSLALMHIRLTLGIHQERTQHRTRAVERFTRIATQFQADLGAWASALWDNLIDDLPRRPHSHQGHTDTPAGHESPSEGRTERPRAQSEEQS